MSSRTTPRQFLRRSPAIVRDLIRSGAELAFLDLREPGAFGRAKPLFAVNLPLGRLEERILSLVPRRATPIVLFDGGEGLAERGALRLADLGYTDVSLVAGGLHDWRLAGGELFRDTNAASKAFGEVVEAEAHTPEIDAAEFKALRDRGEKLVLLDDRPFAEYRQSTIPGSINVPGAELVLRAQETVDSPEDTLVVVHCAGRTRSIIGTQALVNSGLFPRVVGLRNGNIGWTLAGFALEHGAARRAPATLTPEKHHRAVAAAHALALRTGAQLLGDPELARWEAEADRHALFKFDVRSHEEFAAAHAPGFAHAAGGQLIQATDEYIGVLGARIVLADNDGVRAAVTASWLRQLGWEHVAVYSPGLKSPLVRGAAAALRPPAPRVPTVNVAGLREQLRTGRTVVLDLRTSTAFAEAHIPGAWHAPRTQLAGALPALPGHDHLVLVSDDGFLAAFAHAEAHALTDRPVTVLDGGFTAWLAAGQATQSGHVHFTVPPDDVYHRPAATIASDVPAPSLTDEAKRYYIEWELGLVEQIRRDGTARFSVYKPSQIPPVISPANLAAT
ncbi:MAG: rhodanese-like domain-containing protein [Opitutaceae bacterium]